MSTRSTALVLVESVDLRLRLATSTSLQCLEGEYLAAVYHSRSLLVIAILELDFDQHHCTLPQNGQHKGFSASLALRVLRGSGCAFAVWQIAQSCILSTIIWPSAYGNLTIVHGFKPAYNQCYRPEVVWCVRDWRAAVGVPALRPAESRHHEVANSYATSTRTRKALRFTAA